MNENYIKSKKDIFKENDNEINLSILFEFFLRNKFLISAFTLVGLTLGTALSLTIRPIWKGEFQIVLDSSSSGGLAKSRAQGLLKLNTEIETLKSPLVLMSVFDFVQNQKDNSNDSTKNATFKSWKEKLKITLQPGTTVLNVAYLDTEKNSILPVLNKISTTYQGYSGKKRMKGIDQGIKYLEKQLEIYRIKSIESFDNAQKFAISQDFAHLKDKEVEVAGGVSLVNIESVRVKAANEIRYIDSQLDIINKLENNSDQLLYIALNTKGLESLSERLKKVESDILFSKAKYIETDKKIIELKKKKVLLVELIKRNIEGALFAKKIDATSRLKSAERPKDVLIKYQRLFSIAKRDKETFEKLDNQYRQLSLEKARNLEPWELITKPTLLSLPVASNKIRKIIFSAFISSFIGIITAWIYERKKDILYKVEDLDSIKNIPILETLSTYNEKSWSQSIELLINGPLSTKSKELSLITIGQIEKDKINILTRSFENFLGDYKLIVTSDLIEATKLKNILVVIKLGSTKINDFNYKIEKLSQQNNNLLGLLVLSDTD